MIQLSRPRDPQPPAPPPPPTAEFQVLIDWTVTGAPAVTAAPSRTPQQDNKSEKNLFTTGRPFFFFFVCNYTQKATPRYSAHLLTINRKNLTTRMFSEIRRTACVLKVVFVQRMFLCFSAISDNSERQRSRRSNQTVGSRSPVWCSAQLTSTV